MSGGATAVAVDYSVDELDAIADAFGRPILGGARLQLPAAERSELDAALLRTALDTALRGLVARRAVDVQGSASAPRIALLEPHATVLGAFVGATRILAIDARTPDRFERRVLFLDAAAGVVAEQRPTRHAALVRMTARPAADFAALVREALALDPAQDAPARRATLEVSASVLDGDAPAPPGAPSALADLLHARRRTLQVADTRVDGARLERRTSRWLDAGTLGWWRVEPDGRVPAAVMRLIPCAGEEPGAVVAEEQWTRT
jgi:hypothetical protein